MQVCVQTVHLGECACVWCVVLVCVQFAQSTFFGVYKAKHLLMKFHIISFPCCFFGFHVFFVVFYFGKSAIYCRNLTVLIVRDMTLGHRVKLIALE